MSALKRKEPESARGLCLSPFMRRSGRYELMISAMTLSLMFAAVPAQSLLLVVDRESLWTCDWACVFALAVGQEHIAGHETYETFSWEIHLAIHPAL